VRSGDGPSGPAVVDLGVSAATPAGPHRRLEEFDVALRDVEMHLELL
jgi:hypothetical protein